MENIASPAGLGAQAMGVEQCVCPPGYMGTSCEVQLRNQTVASLVMCLRLNITYIVALNSVDKIHTFYPTS